jgi:hypothetical protein
MTNEERQRLCDWLRHLPSYLSEDGMQAAEEIERLAERCADAQRLAFEWMERHDKVIGFISKNYPTVMLPNLPFPSPARSEPADYIPIGGAGNGA